MSSSDSPLLHEEFMAFMGEEDSFALVRRWAEHQGYPGAAVQFGGLELLASMLEQTAPPKVIVIDLDDQIDPAAGAARLSALCGNGTKIVAVGSANDVSLYRRMLTSGVSDYLVKPLNDELLSGSIHAAQKGGLGASAGSKEAQIIVIVGTRGGVGATTLAVNLGWSLGHDLKAPTTILDLDLQFGTTALALDLEPGRGIKEILSNPTRVDGLMVASAMASESDQLSILSAEESLDESFVIDSNAVATLLKELRRNFEYILIDLPRHQIANQRRLLASAHAVILVSELSLVGIRDTLRIKNMLKAIGSTAKLLTVAGRTGGVRPSQVDVATFEKSAVIKIDFSIPEDPKAVNDSANAGKALGAIAPEAPITKIYKELATNLSGKEVTEDKEKKSKIWGLLKKGE
jgi:pilus assembly protein CpaE